MGSFNTKCFASNQTISPGDKALLFPIRSQQGFLYSPIEIKVRAPAQMDGTIIEKVQSPTTDNSLCYPNAMFFVDEWFEYYKCSDLQLSHFILKNNCLQKCKRVI